MLILTENQEQTIKRTISCKIHDILKGKIKSNFDSFSLNGDFYKGYHIKLKKGFLRCLHVELTKITDYYIYFSVLIYTKENQKHTFYIKVNKKTNKIEYRIFYGL